MRSSLSISVRRHFVDQFFFAHSSIIKKGDLVVDISGKRSNKRGLFEIEAFGAKVTYVNIDPSTHPDIEAPAEKIPVPNESFDLAIMGELLEHVADPKLVLKEAYRILRPGGKIIATVPFMYPLHADPYDFGRYTDHFWKKTAEELGFRIEIESQGAIFAVGALMIQHLFLAKKKTFRPIQNTLIKFLMWLDGKTTNKTLRSWTTGFGFVLTK